MLTSDKQGICLVSEDGRNHMMSFDCLPKIARKLLRDSPFNLCASCVGGRGQQIGFAPAILEMEARVRELIAEDALEVKVKAQIQPGEGQRLTVGRPGGPADVLVRAGAQQELVDAVQSMQRELERREVEWLVQSLVPTPAMRIRPRKTKTKSEPPPWQRFDATKSLKPARSKGNPKPVKGKRK